MSYGAQTTLEYRFEDSVQDVSGHGKHGTIVGSNEYVNGYDGNAISLSGSGYINMPLDIMRNTQPFTIAMRSRLLRPEVSSDIKILR